MPNPNPNQPGESTLRNNQAGQQQDDDPRQAKESGEPQVEGRTQGRPVDEKSDSGKAGDSKDWESGRHQAR